MGSLLCLFRRCNWIHLFNASFADDAPCGVYQCSRCKTVSVGCKRAALANPPAPAPGAADGAVGDGSYKFDEIEEAWGDTVPLTKKHFDLFRTRLDELRVAYRG